MLHSWSWIHHNTVFWNVDLFIHVPTEGFYKISGTREVLPCLVEPIMICENITTIIWFFFAFVLVLGKQYNHYVYSQNAALNFMYKYLEACTQFKCSFFRKTLPLQIGSSSSRLVNFNFLRHLTIKIERDCVMTSKCNMTQLWFYDDRDYGVPPSSSNALAVHAAGVVTVFSESRKLHVFWREGFETWQ